MSALRSAWSGEPLGHAYADASKAISLPSHSYRLCLVTGVQEARADALLGEADGGTPQRFLWLPSTDPTAPDVTPDAPPCESLLVQDWPWGADRDFHVLTVPSPVRDLVQSTARAKIRGEVDALDGHALFTREKVAQALTFLDGRRTMTIEDWELSGYVMAESDRTRQRVQDHLRDAKSERNRDRGRSAAETDQAKRDALHDAALERVRGNVLKRLGDGQAWAWSNLRSQIRANDREHYPEAVSQLVEAGRVRVEDAKQNGQILRLGSGAR